MNKKNSAEVEQLSLEDVVSCVKGHLERGGYSITGVQENSVGANITAKKDKENFIIEAVGEEKESSNATQEKELLYAIGEIVRRMKKPDIWTLYGIAIPKSYLKHLKNFEIGGIQLLDFHLLIVENVWSLYHLDAKSTVEVIQNLKAGLPERIVDLDIDFKNFDYSD